MRLGSLAFVVALSVAAPAAADVPLAGGVQGHFLASPDEDLGGGLSADLHFALDWFRIGGFLGVAAVPSDADERNRIFMPFGVSLGLEVLGDVVGVSVRARGGLWGGATQETKLTAGGFVSGAAYLLFVLGGGVSVGVGLEVWGVFGVGETALFSPSLGLTWRPEP
ncbi:MAG: hypothetical protein KF729_04245 [Sandaracinaceae bacterium]|nr:hypothetical protein [Sandaracinaceae bacterium]